VPEVKEDSILACGMCCVLYRLVGDATHLALTLSVLLDSTQSVETVANLGNETVA